MADGRIPGQQSWSRRAEKTMNGFQSTKGHLPKEVYGKYPIPDNEGKYLGALVKVSLNSVGQVLIMVGI